MTGETPRVEGPRGARRDELPQLMHLVNSVFRANKHGDMYARFPVLFSDENIENCRILLVDGKPVSHVACLIRDIASRGTLFRAASLGAVCTDPAYRGRQFASRVLDDCDRLFIERGVHILIISGSRGLYERRGARAVGLQRSYALNPANVSPLIDRSLAFAPAAPTHLSALVALHDSSPVRHVRTELDWRRWLACGRCENAPAQPYLALRNGRPVAYLAHRHHNLLAEAVSSAGEWAGDADAVAALLAWVAQTNAATPLEVILDTAAHADVMQRLDAAGIPFAPAHFGRTVIVLQPGALLDRLRPSIPSAARDLQLVETPDGVQVELNGERLSLPRGDVARLSFGDPEGVLMARLRSAGNLGRALLEAFPVPLPRYGYNYT